MKEDSKRPRQRVFCYVAPKMAPIFDMRQEAPVFSTHFD